MIRKRGAGAGATFREVMTRPYDRESSPYNEAGLLDFVFADIWNRPGLGRRERRWVTLACVGAADTLGPIEAHVYAAMNSGDMSLEEMQEFVLHFAVYCGWPKGSFLDQVVWSQHVRICEERGEPPPAPRQLEVWRPGEDPEQRLQNGAESFATIRLRARARADEPVHDRRNPQLRVRSRCAQRDGLSVRDRRFITVACVGCDGAVTPIRSHVLLGAQERGRHLRGDARVGARTSRSYAGWPKGSFLDQVVAESWDRSAQLGDLHGSARSRLVRRVAVCRRHGASAPEGRRHRRRVAIARAAPVGRLTEVADELLTLLGRPGANDP